MAIAKVTDLGSANSKSSASSIPMTVSANASAGDTVLVSYIGSTTTSAVSSVTDSLGNTYVVLADVAGTTSRIAIAASTLTTPLVSGVSVITVNLAAASGIRCVAATDFSGVTTTQDVTAKSAAGTSSTPSTGASAATTTASTLTYAAFGVSNGTASGTFTQGTGYTLDQAATTGTTGTNRSLGTEHRINSSTGTQTADGTYATSMAWDALEVVLQASGGTTSKSSSDSGTMTDAVSGTALSSTDAATATDAVGSTGLSQPDTQTQTEAVVSTALSATDAATATDAPAGLALSAADAGTLSEGAVVSQPIVASDTFTLTEGTAILPIAAPTGTGGGGDAWERPYVPRIEPQRPTPEPRQRPARERVIRIATPERLGPAPRPEPFTPWFAGPLPAPDFPEPQPLEAPEVVVEPGDEEQDLLMILLLDLI